MKIVYVSTGLGTGGAQIMLYHLLSRINRERFSPVVISLMDHGIIGDRIAALGIPIYTIGMKQGKPTLASIWQLAHTIREINPDLIQGWMYHGNLAAQLANIVFIGQKPILWGIHHSITALKSETKLTQLLIKLGGFLSPYVAKIIFVSKNSKVQHEALNYSIDKTCVIANGFDTDLFKPSQQARSNIREELSLDQEAVLIGLICRYHPMKDHNNFLQAAALLLKKYPNIYFILAGNNVDKNNDNLYQLIQELGIVERVYLLGESSDMPQLTAALDIATSASAYGEAFPLVVGEAMSCGVPCVVTDVGDSAWIVDNTGKVVTPRNSQALAEAWQELIVMTLDKRQALGKAARQRIIECFSLDSIVAQYEALYETILDK
ncbi:glycosyltransferase [Anabaena sp. FACHB-1237]|uniref:glycosyltransferase family 4 protein n=1 Tax=Anabaena sp. FACHB-1237 TaxID=2692769 RepID=UPI0016811506|nr:glycosyltransferase [Anabaena sp. FACHB-1237]MBD2138458.1 glycosyltransferase [Anabaena sp. FACHB-1237]